MNYIKIQQEILKAVYNEKTKNNWRFVAGLHNGRVWVVYKGYAMYAIPDIFWYLDTDKIIDKLNLPLPLSEKIVESHKRYFESAVNCKYTGTTMYQKLELNVYKSNDDKEVHVDPALVKYLDKHYDYEYRMIDRRSPLYIVDDGELVACIMPVNH